jgi:hypothetical protein
MKILSSGYESFYLAFTLHLITKIYKILGKKGFLCEVHLNSNKKWGWIHMFPFKFVLFALKHGWNLIWQHHAQFVSLSLFKGRSNGVGGGGINTSNSIPSHRGLMTRFWTFWVPCNSNGYKRETHLSQTPHTCGLDDMVLDILTWCNSGQEMMGNNTFHKKVPWKCFTKPSHFCNGIGWKLPFLGLIY